MITLNDDPETLRARYVAAIERATEALELARAITEGAERQTAGTRHTLYLCEHALRLTRALEEQARFVPDIEAVRQARRMLR